MPGLRGVLLYSGPEEAEEGQVQQNEKEAEMNNGRAPGSCPPGLTATLPLAPRRLPVPVQHRSFSA